MTVSNETKVGALAAVAITALVLGYSFLKGNKLFQEEQVYYAIYDKVQGLTSSNHVQINGLKVGRVKNMKLMRDNKEGVVVSFYLEKDIKIPKNTVAEIISSDLLGEKAIRLKLGDSKKLAKTGDTLVTAVQPDLSESVRQEVLPVKLKAEQLLSSLDSVATIVQYLLDKKTRNNIRRSLSDVQHAVDNFNRTSVRLDTMVREESKRLKKIFKNVASITNNLKKNNKKVNRLLSNLSQVSDSLKRANIKSTINNAESAISDFATTMDKINKGKGSLGKLTQDEELYNNLNKSARSLDELLNDLKQNPDRYVNFSIVNFGGGKQKNSDKSKKD